MAGILCNSASKTMVSGDTSAEDVETGYLAGERITLATSPSGTNYVWGLSVPTTSAVRRSQLSSSTAAAPTFTPDVAGMYVVTCVVDGSTTYVCRLDVTSAAVPTTYDAIRLPPKTDASIQAPAAGAILYYSSDQDAFCIKLPDDSVSTVDLTVVP